MLNVERESVWNVYAQMLKDWDFAQFFPNWSSPTGVGEDERMEEKSTSSSTASSGGGVAAGKSKSSASIATTPPRLHRRNESDSAINGQNRSSLPAASTPISSGSDALFGTRIQWAGRHRLRDASATPGSDDEPVSLTEFSRKASQLELRGYGGNSKTSEDLNMAVCPPPPRRQKTDLLELKKELEERRRATATRHNYHNHHPTAEPSGGIQMRPNRPPLLKSTSEPCAPLTLFREHQQVRESCVCPSTPPFEALHPRYSNNRSLKNLLGYHSLSLLFSLFSNFTAYNMHPSFSFSARHSSTPIRRSKNKTLGTKTNKEQRNIKQEITIEEDIICTQPACF